MESSKTDLKGQKFSRSFFSATANADTKAATRRPISNADFDVKKWRRPIGFDPSLSRFTYYYINVRGKEREKRGRERKKNNLKRENEGDKENNMKPN